MTPFVGVIAMVTALGVYATSDRTAIEALLTLVVLLLAQPPERRP